MANLAGELPISRHYKKLSDRGSLKFVCCLWCLIILLFQVALLSPRIKMQLIDASCLVYCSSWLPFFCLIWTITFISCRDNMRSLINFSDDCIFRYLQVMSSEGLEISQPALDPDLSSDIHHRITVRNRMKKVHRLF